VTRRTTDRRVLLVRVRWMLAAPWSYPTREVRREDARWFKAARHVGHTMRMEDQQLVAVERECDRMNEARGRAESMTTDVDWTPDGSVDPAFAATLQRLATRTDDAAVAAFHYGPELATPREVEAQAGQMDPAVQSVLRCDPCGATYDREPGVGDVHHGGRCVFCGEALS
jgi:hypothetical protein